MKKINTGEVHFWQDPFSGRWYQDTATGTYPVMFFSLTVLYCRYVLKLKIV